jgi:hypothetical protein
MADDRPPLPKAMLGAGTRQHRDAASARNFHHCNGSRVRTPLIARGASRVMHSAPGARLNDSECGATLFRFRSDVAS